MKKKYNTPKLIAIGDMVHNTLGASGIFSDNASQQASANGTQNNRNQNNGNSGNGFNNNNFNNNGFNNNGF